MSFEKIVIILKLVANKENFPRFREVLQYSFGKVILFYLEFSPWVNKMISSDSVKEIFKIVLHILY